MSIFTKRYEALSQRLSSVEETDSTHAEPRPAREQMSLRTLAPAAQQIVPLIRITGAAKDDEMPFMFKRRRGRRRGLYWLSLGGCIVLIMLLGLLLCGSSVGEPAVRKVVLKPVVRESWAGWAKMRYIFVLYGFG